MPSASRWSYETGGGGWGNNELETYVAGKTGDDTLAYVSDGTLKIYAKKINNTVYSIRMNTTQSWTYGYFERNNFVQHTLYEVIRGIVRRDGSSKFGSNNKFGNFPSASVRWNVYNEDFWKQNDQVDAFDVRLGYA